MSLPTAIVDARAPQAALAALQEHFSVLTFLSQNTTYPAVEGHPDIFMCAIDESILVYAPNCPEHSISNIPDYYRRIEGNTRVGTDLNTTTAYNCCITHSYIFHKEGYTDAAILEQCTHKTFISVPQAYTRCSMICLPNESCITSDAGIAQVLQQHAIPHLLCNPQGIMLPPYKHGFLGGTMGVYDSTVYLLGSCKQYADGDRLKRFIQEQGYTLVELYKGPLYDGGGIFFNVE